MNRRDLFYRMLGIWGMIFIILDSKTSLNGALSGIDICIKTVIPCLFPLFYFSGILQAGFSGQKIPFMRALCKRCGVPEGGEFLLLIGLIGGYPVGAQNLDRACENGGLKLKDAERMLGFCNNAGPAFIFGMAGAMFSDWYIGWLLWMVQIISSLTCGMILPRQNIQYRIVQPSEKHSIAQIMITSIKGTATVCGWVILFRVFINMLDRWIFWAIPNSVSIFITGLLELTNGCIAMGNIENDALRFIAISTLMTVGGSCIAFQTLSVTPHLRCRFYFLGKLVQLLITVPLSILCAILFFPGNISILPAIHLILIPFALLCFLKFKNNSGKYMQNGV